MGWRGKAIRRLTREGFAGCEVGDPDTEHRLANAVGTGRLPHEAQKTSNTGWKNLLHEEIKQFSAWLEARMADLWDEQISEKRTAES